MYEVAASAIWALASEAVGPAWLCLVLGWPHHSTELQLAMCKLAASSITAAASLLPCAAQLGLQEQA